MHKDESILGTYTYGSSEALYKGYKHSTHCVTTHTQHKYEHGQTVTLPVLTERLLLLIHTFSVSSLQRKKLR